MSSELGRYLYLAGALPFLMLGTAHALATPRAPADAKGLSPFDPQLAEAMTRSTLRLTRRTDMWRAGGGFNLAPSPRAAGVAALVFPARPTAPAFAAHGHHRRPFAVLVPRPYLSLR